MTINVTSPEMRWAWTLETDPNNNRPNRDTVPSEVRDVGLKRYQPITRQMLNEQFYQITLGFVDVQNQLDTQAGNNATTSNKGLVELATTAEAVAATDTSRAVVATGVRAAIDDRFENVNATSVQFGTVKVSPTKVRSQAQSYGVNYVFTPSQVKDIFSEWVASDAEYGTVQLATGAELTAGTPSARVVTVGVLSNAKATDAEAYGMTLADKFITASNLAALRATDAEAQAMTSNLRYITPANVGAMKASSAEAQAMTNDTKFVTARQLFEVRASNTDVEGLNQDRRFITPLGLKAMVAENSEIDAGTSNARFVTPAGLQRKINNIPSVGDASTTQKGVVELATQAEAIAGTSTTLVPTVAGMDAAILSLINEEVVTATTTVKGIVELATETEARNWTAGKVLTGETGRALWKGLDNEKGYADRGITVKSQHASQDTVFTIDLKDGTELCDLRKEWYTINNIDSYSITTPKLLNSKAGMALGKMSLSFIPNVSGEDITDGDGYYEASYDSGQLYNTMFLWNGEASLKLQAGQASLKNYGVNHTSIENYVNGELKLHSISADGCGLWYSQGTTTDGQVRIGKYNTTDKDEESSGNTRVLLSHEVGSGGSTFKSAIQLEQSRITSTASGGTPLWNMLHDLSVTGNITATGTITPFTGAHPAKVPNQDAVVFEKGDLICETDVQVIDVDNALGNYELSSKANQKNVLGVYSSDKKGDPTQDPEDCFIYEHIDPEAYKTAKEGEGRDTAELNYLEKIQVEEDVRIIFVNGVGEGAINVCGENGDIEVGDLLVSSNMAGKAMKQDDDLVRSYTVAKARKAHKFKSADEVVMLPCIYLCG